MMIFILAIILLLSGYGYYRIKKSKGKLISLATELVFKIMKDPKISFAVGRTGKSASIIYPRNGKEYIINVPYDANQAAEMAGSKTILYLDEEGKNKIDISQQPGIPLLVSAEMLGGIRIEIETEDEKFVYSKNEIPYFPK